MGPHATGVGGAENGIANVFAPANSLIGVFLDASQPDSSPAPAGLSFSTAASWDYTVLSPGLKQPFFIGDGLTSGGLQQQVIVPAGATRLFLGTMDGFGWYDNVGFFEVRVSCAIQPAGMVSWWPGDGIANDIVGTNNGTLQNGTTFAAGMVGVVFGTAFSLDGVDDYVDVGSGFNLNALTLDAWVFITPATNTGERRIISKDNVGLVPDAQRKFFALKTSSPFVAGNTGRASFSVGINLPAGLDQIEAPSALTAGWHHLAGVRDTAANRFELYVDGVMVASKIPTIVGAIDVAVNTLLGRVSTTFASEHFNGRIDEAEIFNRGLSGAEIAAIYSAAASGKCRGAAAAGAVGGGCPAHTVHGHLPGAPTGHNGTDHSHHGLHGHNVAPGASCPVPHAPGHSAGLTAEPEIVMALNPDGTVPDNGPARDFAAARLRAARAGEVIQVFARAAPAGNERPVVRIGDLDAEVISSGPAPGLDGAWLLQVRIPEAAPRGRQLHVTVIYGGREWPSLDVTIQ